MQPNRIGAKAVIGAVTAVDAAVTEADVAVTEAVAAAVADVVATVVVVAADDARKFQPHSTVTRCCVAFLFYTKREHN